MKNEAMLKKVEREISKKINFSKLDCQGGKQLIPAVAQDYKTKEILMVGHVDSEGLALSLINRVATFWSVSRNKRWVKGDGSGNFLDIVDILLDCEAASVVYLVIRRQGGACHFPDENGQSRISCFFRRLVATKKGLKLEPIK